MAGNWRVIGHAGAVKLLSGALEANRLAHAYLITGPDRVGRRTLALALARAINCEAESGRPCGECSQCTRAARGIHSGIRVIDRRTPIRGTAGADPSDEDQDQRRPRISIEHIRELQHAATLNPFEGRSHVFVLDGAETLKFEDGPATEAANALLKTLEEPNERVAIVLVAPSRASLPDTVASRCHVIDLRPVAVEEIAAGLVELHGAAAEGAERAARLADGRPGRAVELLEDPAAQDRYVQTIARVLETSTGTLERRFRYARDLAGAYRRDRSAVTGELATWASLWRDVLLAKHGLSDAATHADWQQAIDGIASQLDATAISAVIEAARDTSAALALNASPQLAIEVMMLALPPLDATLVPRAAGTTEAATAG